MERQKLEEENRRKNVKLKDSVQDLLYINNIIEQAEAGKCNAHISESVLMDLKSNDAIAAAT